MGKSPFITADSTPEMKRDLFFRHPNGKEDRIAENIPESEIDSNISIHIRGYAPNLIEKSYKKVELDDCSVHHTKVPSFTYISRVHCEE